MRVSADKAAIVQGPASTGARAEFSVAYNAYITLTLALVFMLAATDRNILAILLVPIQKDLGVSDTAMGALTGTAFSLVYATTALPLARLADRGDRRNLIAGAVAFWSAMTAFCGVATSFVTLLLARMGVAVGEAAHQPSIMSMVGDLYPRQRRGMAIAWLSVGAAVGIAFGAYVAGLLSDRHGWRTAFFVMAAPGLVVALLVIFTLPEPKRGAFDAPPKSLAEKDTLWNGVRYLAKIPTIPRLLAAKLLMMIGFQAWLVWLPAFFMRVHGMTTTEMSAGFGSMVGLGAVTSNLLAGFIGDRLSKRGERWRSYYCTIAILAGVPAYLLTILSPSGFWSMIGLLIVSVVVGGATSASLTAGLSVVRPTSRGLMTAAMAFCISVIGGGIGPLLIGGLNDSLKAVYGDHAVRYTLLAVPVIMTLSAIMYYFAGRTTDKDAAAAQE
jgi:predicted MFS family arabinose efflux permease